MIIVCIEDKKNKIDGGKTMGRNNENAGMHFVRYGRNVYDSYGYDKYVYIIAEQRMQKSAESSCKHKNS